jgi:hypothetical protein
MRFVLLISYSNVQTLHQTQMYLNTLLVFAVLEFYSKTTRQRASTIIKYQDKNHSPGF